MASLTLGYLFALWYFTMADLVAFLIVLPEGSLALEDRKTS